MAYTLTEDQSKTQILMLMVFDSELSDNLKLDVFSHLVNVNFANDSKFHFLRQSLWFVPLVNVDLKTTYELLTYDSQQCCEHANFKSCYDFYQSIMTAQPYIVEINELWKSACKSKPQKFNDDYLLELLYKTSFFEYMVKQFQFAKQQLNNHSISFSEPQTNEEYDNIFKSLIFNDL